MPDHDGLSRELVALLADGATVAELIRHCRQAIGADAPPPDWFRAVRKAFGLNPGGWTLPYATASFGDGRVPDSDLTWAFLPDILAKRDVWDTPDGTPRWFDGLEKTPEAEQHERAATTHGLSADGWAGLSERDRGVVQAIENSRLGLSEDVRILAALAERLQQRVNELEQRPATVGTV